MSVVAEGLDGIVPLVASGLIDPRLAPPARDCCRVLTALESDTAHSSEEPAVNDGAVFSEPPAAKDDTGCISDRYDLRPNLPARLNRRYFSDMCVDSDASSRLRKQTKQEDGLYSPFQGLRLAEKRPSALARRR